MEMVKANKKQMFISKIQTSKKQKSRQEILKDKNKIESTEDSLGFLYTNRNRIHGQGN